MASFSLIFKPSTEKDMRSLPKTMVGRVLERIEKLADDPFPPQAIKLSGTERLHRLRVGDFRVIYEVDTKRSR